MIPALRKFIGFILFVISFSVAGAQMNDSLYAFSNHVIEAEKLYFKDKFDSALLLSNNAIAMGKRLHYEKDFLFSRALLVSGNSYIGKKEWTKAHDNLFTSYHNALRNKHRTEEIDAFTALNQLHADIMKKDLPFRYSPATTTVNEQVAFQVAKTEQQGDSTIITLYGGYLDGITDSSNNAELFSRHTQNPLRESGFITNGKIKKITQNRTTAIIKGNFDIQQGDMAFINAQVPIHFNKTAFKKTDAVWHICY